jgi:hypothetical protein
MLRNGINLEFEVMVAFRITGNRMQRVWSVHVHHYPDSGALCRLSVNNCCVAQSFRDTTAKRNDPRECHVPKYKWAYNAVAVFPA